MEINLILDRINSIGYAKTVYEVYCEHNAFKLSKITIDEFEDIFFSLFDDDIDDLIMLDDMKISQLEDSEDYHERIEIIYNEIIDSAFDNFKFEQFLKDIPESEWSNIIKIGSASYLSELDDYIFENYKKLRSNGHIIEG
jgi:hypothetical protein